MRDATRIQMDVEYSCPELVVSFRNCSELQAAIVFHKADKAYLLKCIVHIFRDDCSFGAGHSAMTSVYKSVLFKYDNDFIAFFAGPGKSLNIFPGE